MSSNAEGVRWVEEPPPSARRVSRRSMAPWYALLLLLMTSVVAGIWWIVTRREAPPPELPIESVPLNPPQTPEASAPLADPGVTTASQAEPETATAITNEAETSPAPLSSATSARPTTPRSEVARRSIRQARARGQQGAAEPLASEVYRTPPNSGRIVQLGAFPTQREADREWRRIARRYPYLATKPRLVSPVDVGAFGGGRRTTLYRLQLGTASQAQSLVICQQLERAGQSCVVVY